MAVLVTEVLNPTGRIGKEAPVDRPPVEEAALLSRINGGDRAAFGTLYDRYSRSVYSVALRILGDAAAAEDVAQDVFMAVWRGAGAFDPSRGSVRMWILSLAHHKSVDALRRQSLRAASPLDEHFADHVDVADEIVRRVAGESVRTALDQLPPLQRQAIVLAYYGGYTGQEIAARLDVPLGTVKTRLRDGLLRLRRYLAVPQ